MRGESSKEFMENIGSHVRMLVKIFLNIHTIFKSIVEETFRIRVQVSKKKHFMRKEVSKYPLGVRFISCSI